VPADALQFLQQLPSDFSVVSDAEYQLLSLLPEFEQRGESLRRVDGEHEYFVLRQSFYDRLVLLEAEVDAQQVDNAAGRVP
jgi:hypothetical protein